MFQVTRCKLDRVSQHVSKGECVEPSSLGLEPVYKKVYQYPELSCLNIDIDEFKINPDGRSPDHSSKWIAGLRYQFTERNNKEEMKVMTFLGCRTCSNKYIS